MTQRRLYHALADAFRAEGVRAVFALMGDGNMHWVNAMAASDKAVRVVHVRHEHCACGMAIGYHSATGAPGVASVTYGPGVTQLSTVLTSAAMARIPLVVFAGEAPLDEIWHGQHVEQAPFVVASGAHYVRAHSAHLALQHVREAFHVARAQRRPVVLGVPFDLQHGPAAALDGYRPSTDLVARRPMPQPDPDEVARIADRLAGAQHPVLVAGRGAVAAGAGPAIAALADRAGALLGTTLPARGLFDAHPFSLGIVGGFSTVGAARELKRCDLMLAFGAGMSQHMTGGGRTAPGAHVVQIDTDPVGLKDGVPAADTFLVADARLAAEAIADALKGRTCASRARSSDFAERLAAAAPGGPVAPEPDALDPGHLVTALDEVIPKDWDIVAGSGHSSYFHAQMRGRRPDRFHVIREFGAIGNAISIAVGVAASESRRNVVLMEGDGSLMMHIQELDTLKRHGIRLLVCVFNDGAYGAELHKLRAEGLDASAAHHGRADFAGIARGFGLRGARVDRLGDLPALFDSFSGQRCAEIWDFPVSDRIMSPRMRERTRNTAS